MKKVLIFILLFALSITVVRAEGSINFDITNARILETNGAVEVIPPSFSSSEINSNIIFKDIGDFVIYEITIKNND